MKKMRIPLLITLGVIVIVILIGSFVDLPLSTAIGNSSNKFGIFVSAVSPTISLIGIAALAGGLVGVCIRRKEYDVSLKIALIILAIGAIGACSYLAGKEFFGTSGFAGKASNLVGYIIAGVVLVCGGVFGFFLFKDSKIELSWLLFLVIIGMAFAMFLLVGYVLKGYMARPRYRLFATTADVSFHAWYSRCTEANSLMSTLGIAKEEFSSFPSGHMVFSSSLMAVITFMPLFNEKLTKVQFPVYIIASVFALFVGFTRILAAAHYLTDVAFGMLAIMLPTFILNELVIHLKFLHYQFAEEA